MTSAVFRTGAARRDVKRPLPDRAPEDRENEEGTRYPVGVTRPDDPVLRAVFDEIGDEPGEERAQVVARTRNQKPPKSCAATSKRPGGCLCSRDAGWVMFPPLVELRDDALSAVWPTASPLLRRGVAGEPADERPLKIGLTGPSAACPRW